MTARAIPLRRQGNPFGAFLLILVGALLVYGIFLASTHAVITHGNAAIAAQRCFQGEGKIIGPTMVDLLTGRTMEFCKDMGGRYYVKIDACDGGNVTCYPRSFAKSLSDLVNYAKRAGFTRELPTLP